MKIKYKNHEGMKEHEPTVEKKIGSWAPMQYDASMVRFGITWRRVFNGMGGRGDREDWVADVPGLSLSVHDYNWTETGFGINYGTPEKAMLAQIKDYIFYGKSRVEERTKEIAELDKGITILEKSLAESL